MFRTGTFVAEKGFSVETCGLPTKRMREGSVEGLVQHSHRFDALLKSAREFIPFIINLRAKEESSGAAMELEGDGVYGAVDPSSSPVYDDF